MKAFRIAFIAAAAGTIPALAFAADMRAPARAPVVAPVAAYNWTGWYVGAHLGGAWSDVTASDTPIPSAAVANQPFLSFDNGDSGIIGGAQLGYNWQLAPNWVIGVEADFSWTSLKGSTTYAPVPVVVGVPLAGSTETMSTNIDWVGTVRGRLGYAWDRTMLYVTGGFAYGSVQYNSVAIFPGGSVYGFNSDTTRTGYTIGGGLEHGLSMFGGNWTVRVEYLYYNLEGTSGTSFGVPSTAPVGSAYLWDDIELHVVRAGLNYRF